MISKRILFAFRQQLRLNFCSPCRPYSAAVTEEVVNKFHKNGAVCLRGVFEEEWIEKVKQGIKKVRETPSDYSESLEGDSSSASYFNDYNNWRRIPEFKDFVFNSPAGKVAGKLMNSQKALFYHEHVFSKDPGNYRTAPWHQDQPYYPVDGKQACSVWMPVTPVSQDACIKYVKGSHNWGKWFHPRKFATKKKYDHSTTEVLSDKSFLDAPDIDNEPDKYELLSWELQPGDCVVFQMLTLHGSPRGTDTSGRQVFVTRWFGEDMCFGTRPWEVSPPYSGKLKPGDPLYPSEEFPLVWSAHKHP